MRGTCQLETSRPVSDHVLGVIDRYIHNYLTRYGMTSETHVTHGPEESSFVDSICPRLKEGSVSPSEGDALWAILLQDLLSTEGLEELHAVPR